MTDDWIEAIVLGWLVGCVDDAYSRSRKKRLGLHLDKDFGKAAHDLANGMCRVRGRIYFANKSLG